MSDRNLHPVMQAALAPFMPERPRIGDLRIGAWSDYEPGADGYVIEEYWDDQRGWVMGHYEENGEAHLDGVFATRADAERALNGETV